MANESDKVYDLLKEYDNVMLVTHGAGNRLDARPMNIAKLERNCDVWFLTHVDDKVRELQRNPQAQIVAQDKQDSWLSISGQVEILNDRAIVDEVWKEPYRAWFPDGKDDPNLRLLAFRAERGEFWDQRGTNRIEYGIKVLKAYVTGEPPQPDPGTHGTEQL